MYLRLCTVPGVHVKVDSSRDTRCGRCAVASCLVSSEGLRETQPILPLLTFDAGEICSFSSLSRLSKNINVRRCHSSVLWTASSLPDESSAWSSKLLDE